jgi:pyrroloquinoline quinone biosynthesis protein D
MTLDSVPQQAPAVVSRLIDGEAVLVHPGQGKVRVLNPVGARLWELADGVRTAGDIAQIIASEYDVDLVRAEADVLAFCSDLVDRGVLTILTHRPEPAQFR